MSDTVPLTIAQVAYGQRHGELEGPDRLRVIIANTPEEFAAIGHVRGWCHDGSACSACHLQSTEGATMRIAGGQDTLDQMQAIIDLRKDGA